MKPCATAFWHLLYEDARVRRGKIFSSRADFLAIAKKLDERDVEILSNLERIYERASHMYI